MASGTLDKPDDRADALALLDRGRAEISAEMRWLKSRVNPKEALRRGFDQHPMAVIGTGVALGLAAALLIWQRHRHPQEKHLPSKVVARLPAAAPRRPGGLAGYLFGQAAHMLVPLVVMPALENFVKRRFKHGSSTSFPS